MSKRQFNLGDRLHRYLLDGGGVRKGDTWIGNPGLSSPLSLPACKACCLSSVLFVPSPPTARKVASWELSVGSGSGQVLMGRHCLIRLCAGQLAGELRGRAPEQRRGHPAPSTGLARLTSRWRTAELRGCWTRPCGASDVMVWRCYREESHPVAGHRPPPTTCPTREGSREVEAEVVSSTKEPLAANNTIHPFSRFMGRCSGRAS